MSAIAAARCAGVVSGSSAQASAIRFRHRLGRFRGKQPTELRPCGGLPRPNSIPCCPRGSLPESTRHSNDAVVHHCSALVAMCATAHAAAAQRSADGGVDRTGGAGCAAGCAAALERRAGQPLDLHRMERVYVDIVGQLALRRPLSAPDHCLDCHRFTPVNREPAVRGLSHVFSTQERGAFAHCQLHRGRPGGRAALSANSRFRRLGLPLAA